jgi:hypothetical protein
MESVILRSRFFSVAEGSAFSQEQQILRFAQDDTTGDNVTIQKETAPPVVYRCHPQKQRAYALITA